MEQIGNIRYKLCFCYTIGNGPDNDSHTIRFQLACNGTQAVPFLFVPDFFGNANIIHGRHQHSIPAGQTDVGRHFRAFAPLFFLYDLDEYTLADRNTGLLDLFLCRCPGKEVAKEQKGILSAPYIDKGSLHGRQNILYGPLVYMIDNMIFVIPFHRKITQYPLIEDSYPRFFGHDIANNCLHRSSPAFNCALPSVSSYTPSNNE